MGILFPFASNEEKDMLVATIGPFWGANVTWLVLAIGPLLVAYSFIDACRLILKTEYTLQAKAVDWAQGGIWGLALGLGAVSIVTLLVSPRVFDKWFTYPEIVLQTPMPLLSAVLIWMPWRSLQRLPNTTDKRCAGTVPLCHQPVYSGVWRIGILVLSLRGPGKTDDL